MPADQCIALSVDGREIQAPDGARLLDVLRGLGVSVPTLCHDERLAPYGGCRLCVVARRDGRGGLVPACSTPVLPGMVIETASADVLEARRQQLRLLSLNHPLECPACERHGDCQFQDLLYEYGVPSAPLPFERMRSARDEGSPVIVRDPEKCILCGKCVRLCAEVQGVGAIALVHRGLNARVATLLDQPLDCEFCGQCVNACPVAALTSKPYASDVPSWLRQAETTTCGFCSCGCQVTVERHDGQLVRVTSDQTLEPNHGKLCVKGWLGADILRHGDRLTAPLVRRDGQLVEATWAEALTSVATAIRNAAAAGERVVAIGGARLTSEAAYLMQRLFRTAGATAEVGLGTAAGAAALTGGMAALTDQPRSSATFDDLRAADLVLVLRADPSRTHPLIKTELVQGVVQRRQKLALVHALSGGLERHATLYLPVEPGGEAALLHGVAARLRACADEALGGVPGFDEWVHSVAAHTPSVIADACGVSEERLDRLCALLQGARKCVTVVVAGLGIPGDEAEVTRAALALDAMLGERGGGVMVLGEEANLQGAIDAGLHADWLPGGQRASDADARARVAGAWKHEIAAPRALQAHDDDRAPGVVYLAAQDPLGAMAGRPAASDLVARARIVIVQDGFLTETARAAHVVLPVAVLFEREGSVVGADGVRRQLRASVAPTVALPQDAELFQAIGARLGLDVPDREALSAAIAEITAPTSRRSIRRLVPVRAPTPRSRPVGKLLDVSPQLFRSGSMTERSRTLQELAPSIALRLSPRDAAELGVGNGDRVRVAAGGRTELFRTRLDPTVRPGTVVTQGVGRWGGATSRLIGDGEAVMVEIRRS